MVKANRYRNRIELLQGTLDLLVLQTLLWGAQHGYGISQAIRYGLRRMRREPQFAFVAILTLALGIGACTSIFSIVDAVLLRPLPYPEAGRLLSLREVDAKGRQITFAEPNFLDVRARNRTLAATAQYNAGLTNVVGGSEPVRTSVASVSGDFFKALGVQPAAGRGFLPEEARAGGPAGGGGGPGFLGKV